MPFRLVPPRWGPSVTRFVPCSMRCTGRPRPIRDVGSMRFMTRSIAETSWCGRGRGARQQRRTGHRRHHLGRCRGVRRRPAPGRVGRGPSERTVATVAGAAGVHPEARHDGAKGPLSIPAVRDRVVQAALKIVLEPIFEADFLPCSFGFRPKRSAHDALQVLIDRVLAGQAVGGRNGHRELFRGDSVRQVDASGVRTCLRLCCAASGADDAPCRGDAGRPGPATGYRHPAGRGRFPVDGEHLSAPDRSGMG